MGPNAMSQAKRRSQFKTTNKKSVLRVRQKVLFIKKRNKSKQTDEQSRQQAPLMSVVFLMNIRLLIIRFELEFD